MCVFLSVCSQRSQAPKSAKLFYAPQGRLISYWEHLGQLIKSTRRPGRARKKCGPRNWDFCLFVCNLKTLLFPYPYVRFWDSFKETSVLFRIENRVRNRENTRPPQNRQHRSVSSTGETMRKKKLTASLPNICCFSWQFGEIELCNSLLLPAVAH